MEEDGIVFENSPLAEYLKSISNEDLQLSQINYAPPISFPNVTAPIEKPKKGIISILLGLFEFLQVNQQRKEFLTEYSILFSENVSELHTKQHSNYSFYLFATSFFVAMISLFVVVNSLLATIIITSSTAFLIHRVWVRYHMY